jgi:hypothetical protein
MVTFSSLWSSHPGMAKPCAPEFANQCAIRMTVALHGAGIDTSKLSAVRCWHGHNNPSHILRAQQFATALAKTPGVLGSGVTVKKMAGSMNSNLASFKAKRGVIFIQNGWGETDHIDLWDGIASQMAGSLDTAGYMMRGANVWFWQMT